MNVKDISIRKQLGAWQPNKYLSNLCLSYFEDAQFAAKRVFPTCPVELPSGYFYTFSKADLARDNVKLKPDNGAVTPAVMGISDSAYNCRVHQILIGLDKLVILPYQRDGGGFDPERASVKTINEQLNLHLELEFARNFFKSGVWQNQWTGAASDNYSQKKFQRFDDTTSDPISFIDSRMIEIRREGRKRPNKLVLGIDSYIALKNHPAVSERIKYTGTNAAPAVVNETVLAQIFGVDSVIVLDATYNAGGLGEENMQFVCDSKAALLLYAPDEISIDTPSAGMIFAWQINGADYIALDRYEGRDGSHVDLVEGLMAFDMCKTADCLACYMAGCVA